MDNEDGLKSLGYHAIVHDRKTSALRKYQDLVIGDQSFLHLLRYEVLILLLANVPGALGLFLRQKFYRPLFAHLGKRVVMGAGISLRQPRKITVSKACVIEDLATLAVRGDETSSIILGDGVFVGRATIIKTRKGKVFIDKDTTISSSCRIGTAGGGVRIGRYVQVGAFCYIGGGDHRTAQLDTPMALQGSESRGGVTIEDDVWIGAHSFIKDGVTIGRGSIIGACSFVNKDIPAYSVAFGCPAKVRGHRDGSENSGDANNGRKHGHDLCSEHSELSHSVVSAEGHFTVTRPISM
ncbi:MAG: acyltransferase [Nitrososphaera sp.]|nr:acyltransferase [Nitrososphaera sp.]